MIFVIKRHLKKGLRQEVYVVASCELFLSAKERKKKIVVSVTGFSVIFVQTEKPCFPIFNLPKCVKKKVMSETNARRLFQKKKRLAMNYETH